MKRELHLLVDGSEAKPDDGRRGAEAARALTGLSGRGALSDADHEALLALAVGDEAAGFDETTREEAEALRLALDTGAAHPLGDLVAATRAAAGLGALGSDLHEALLRRVLERPETSAASHEDRPLEAAASLDAAAPPRVVATHPRARRPRTARTWGWVAFGSFAAAAAALVVLLRAGSLGTSAPDGAMTPAAFLRARSTDELFDPTVPFEARGGESERLTRIAQARGADLRANRFAAWGVR